MTSNFDTFDRNAQKGGDFVPRLAMINDIAGFGRCSTTVSLPVISVMKVQVCPVPLLFYRTIWDFLSAILMTIPLICEII